MMYQDFATFYNRLMLQATMTLETGLRIGSGAGDSVVGANIPVVRDALGRPFIPGSSFKGALRVTVERLARTIDRRPILWACHNPLDTKSTDPERRACVTDKDKEDILRDATTNGRIDEQKFARDLAAKTCTVCRVFGSPWLASKVRIKDLSLLEKSWAGRVEVRTGVGIERDTRTAAGQVLYSFEAVPAGTQFRCEIVVENADEVELGLLLLGLREMQQGRVPLGGARSRGLGWSKLSDWEEIEWVDQSNLLDYITAGKTGAPPKPLKDYIKGLKDALGEGGA
jgi:CRISPR-associated RAMP protein (TIGR02581 family)